ncbi:hypothetical protein LZ30DRAFT_737510 [Colletotrichum cereale]|nr:hypothetical protein LZ30DRAFT_737510 [Colletotrichum cereale]
MTTHLSNPSCTSVFSLITASIISDRCSLGMVSWGRSSWAFQAEWMMSRSFSILSFGNSMTVTGILFSLK